MRSLKGARIWVAGAQGMVGSALVRRLAGYDVIEIPGRAGLDLRVQGDVAAWMERARPDVVFLAAARVGGIMDNARNPADFITDNLQIQTNVMSVAARLGVSRLVFLSSSCIYPRHAQQPMKEAYLLSGPLEETNRAYAVAKLAGMELARALRVQHGCDFISVLPCNLYGPGDRYDAVGSHVIPALMLKFRDALASGAQEITLWGSGTPLREFMHVDDLADACVAVAERYTGDGPVNIGTGEEISIADLAAMLARISGYTGRIVFDADMPDGTPRKLLDITQLSALPWHPSVRLEQGLSRLWAQQPWRQGRP